MLLTLAKILPFLVALWEILCPYFALPRTICSLQVLLYFQNNFTALFTIIRRKEHHVPNVVFHKRDRDQIL